MSSYTQTDGTAAGDTYFQDVEISPVTLADGTLVKRFDTKRYPQLGQDAGAGAGGITPAITLTADNSAPAAAAAVLLTATVTGRPTGKYPRGNVTFKDGATVLGTGTLGSGVATLNVAGGFTAGTHHITAVFPGDGLYDTATSTVHDVVAT